MDLFVNLFKGGNFMYILPSCFKFLYNDWIFLIPIALIIYSVRIWYKAKGETDKEKITVKRIYYSISIIIFLIVIRNENIYLWCKDGPMNINSDVWSHIVAMIIFLLIAISIDYFIISGYVFKELGIFGAKFIKEDTKEIVKENTKYHLALIKTINSLCDVPEYISKYFKNILLFFYDIKDIDVDIDVYFYEHKDSESIIKKYENQHIEKITSNHKKNMKKCLESDFSNKYFEIGKSKLFFINYQLEFENNNKKQLLISVRSEGDLIASTDIPPILNFLYFFMMQIS